MRRRGAAAADESQLGLMFDTATAFVRKLLAGEAEPAPAEEIAGVADGQAAEEAGAISRASGQLLARLRILGLQHVRTIVLTRNRSVVVSLKGFELRLHEGFRDAPDEIHIQIVRFVTARRAWERHAARRAILAYPIPLDTKPSKAPDRTHPADEPLAAQLAEWHTRLNGERFGATLRTLPIRVSRRMVRRLGHYAPGVDGSAPEIAISVRHIRRDGFASAVETLLHEMVHQWQHEHGLPIDHGLDFRRKCREVGAVPRAKRR